MKLALKILIVGLIAIAPTTARAAAAGGTGLVGTAHDFSGRGGGVGLCTFCHTPHSGAKSQLLWNHTLSTSTFSWDAARTTGGTTFPTFRGDTYTGPSAKCLSCHDGTVAVGDIGWWSQGKPAILDNTRHTFPDRVNVGASGGVPGSMRGNHPVAMPYPYLNAKNTYNGVTSGDGVVLSDWQATPLANIRLFNDDGAGNIAAGAVAGKTGIECSSCHDPHNRASVDRFFLRGRLAGTSTEYICLKCHVK